MLCAKKLNDLIKTKYPDAECLVLDSVDSTNTYAKKRSDILLGLICARTQTAGRGRQGHSFYSPLDTGLYMTAVLPLTPMQAYEFSLTAAAAVAAARAVERLSGITVQIKWVNDLYSEGKKIAGILTEADTNRIIVGIGINVTTALFPAEVPNAGSLGTDIDRSDLAAAVFLELADMALSGDRGFMTEYRSRSMLLGKKISYLQNGILKYAEATDIDGAGRLIVKDDLGQIIPLSSGEISIVI